MTTKKAEHISENKVLTFERIVPDTSILIEGVLSERLSKNEIKTEKIIISFASLSELEHQANKGLSIGYLGLTEVKAIRELSQKSLFEIAFGGRKPNPMEVRNASLGEVDAIIRELAYDEDATLITGDKIQAKVAEARGIKVLYIAPKKTAVKKLKIESYFDEQTMSVHLKESVIPYAKRGIPGNWSSIKLSETPIEQDLLQEISTEIIEESKSRRDSYIEIEREGSTIVQLGNYRIVITRPPLSDGWEITAVRPVKKLTLEEYNLTEKLKERITKQAEGVLVAGAPGMGKTTFASALAIFYANQEKTVKTIEAPRDLQLPDNVTQYAISHSTPQEIHDLLLLTRPDYTFFDEMRNTKDFLLFADLRLAGVGMVGVMHGTKAIDAIQRFVGRIELGVIPHVIDTVIFIKNGQISRVLSLNMIVKVPSGMTEADLARPVVVVTDFETGKLEFEIYSYGEETVVIPVSEQTELYDPTKTMAARQLESELKNYASDAKVKILSGNKIEVHVPKEEIGQLIGKEGSNIEKIEKKLGFRIDVKELTEKEKSPSSSDEKQSIPFQIEESKNAIVLRTSPRYAGQQADIYIDEHFLFTSTIGKKGDLKIHKHSKLGQTLLFDLNKNRKVEIRI